MMKILLIGNTGQLGWELERTLNSIGKLIAIDYPAIDLADIDGLRNLIQDIKPDVLVNAAAYTAVDKAEEEKDLADQINAIAPGVMAEESLALGTLFLHYSTNYVFDGKKGKLYLESDNPKPINIYGKTKLNGEKAIQQVGGDNFIFRTSWVYSTRKVCFVTKVLDWARKNKELRIVSDQVGNPTWCRTLAEISAQWLILALSKDDTWRKEKSGIYHVAGIGAVSRYEWAEKILQLDPNRVDQVVESLQPALSAEFPTPAKRPEFTALDCSHFQQEFGITWPEWVRSLELAMSLIPKQ
jgi:dTDP-4-dehydrorhamnose reductase